MIKGKSEYDNGSWLNQGAGLFVDFHFTDGCEVMNLQMANRVFGSVQLGLFDVKNEIKLTYVTKRADEKRQKLAYGGFRQQEQRRCGIILSIPESAG